MPVPQVHEEFRDGGLSGGALARRRSVTLGVARSGPVGVLTSCATDTGVKDTFTGGPMAEALACKLLEAGGPQFGYRMEATVAGVVGYGAPFGNGGADVSSTTHTGTGTGTVTGGGSVSDAPVSFVLKVTVGGAALVNSPKGRFSLDGGVTYGPEVTLVASMDVPGTDLTLTIANGSGTSWVAADLYRFVATPGEYQGDGSVSVGLVPGQTTPTDRFELVVRLTRAGVTLAAATAAFTYSLDGGNVVSPEIAVPTGGTYDLPGTNLRLTFANGSGDAFRVGDGLLAWTSQPGFTLGELEDALGDLSLDPREWEFVHVVGASTGAIASGVSTVMASLEAGHQFSWALLEARPRAAGDTVAEYEASLVADFGPSLLAPRVAIAAGSAEITSPLTLRREWRPAAWLAAARIVRIPLGQDAAWVGYGPFQKLQVSAIDYDANAYDALDDARFLTLRTIKGKRGYFVTNAYTFAAPDSDYHYLVARRVIDEAARTVRPVALNLLSSSVRLNEADAQPPLVAGAIYEPDAKAVDLELTQAARAAVVATGQATAAKATVDRTVVLSVVPAPEIPVLVETTPLGYLRAISLAFGFRNPAAG